MAASWDPGQYLKFSDDRARPFFDLLGRVTAVEPTRIIDLGCGPGNLTATLAQRWPSALVTGIDSSPEMIAACPSGDRLEFVVGEIERQHLGADLDLVISNAALHWVPGHRQLLREWAAALPSGATMAWQVPGNFGAPSHRLLVELATSPRWVSRFRRRERPSGVIATPAEYAELLLTAGWSADVWETTYLHVLQGDDAVLDWVRGTTLGPIRAALEPADFAEFERDYAASLRAAYPASPFGTVYPFRRVFAVGRKP